MRKGTFFVAITIHCAFAFMFASCNFSPTESVGERYEATITDVYSGDTVEVLFNYDKPDGCRRKETLRLIGAKAPLLNDYPFIGNDEYYALESYYSMTKMFGKMVYIELDDVMYCRNRNGFLMAYVWSQEPLELINKKLISEGLAEFDGSVNFNASRMEEFIKAHDSAKKAHNGMWR